MLVQDSFYTNILVQDYNPKDLATYVANVDIDADKGNLPVVERGFIGYIELQRMIIYQEPFFDPLDNKELSSKLDKDKDEEIIKGEGEVREPITSAL